ncbi:hypothetical protein OV203_00655 [Nannocystis sp. ILAH1]|uniref:hypothetical protein n=1 Tax=Nannocystis sp. ILAH1 TaxID=2996789 RepID=UPI00227177AC|nr:hypothetical protein [Nannocystis sp. ILAH1]
MHFSEIVKRAVDRNLLSHVGRDPVAAMQASLNAAVRGDSALLVRSKPGYFQLRPGAAPPPAAVPEPPEPPLAPAPPPAPAPTLELPFEAPPPPAKKSNDVEALQPKVEANSMLTEDTRDEEETSEGAEEGTTEEGGGRRRRRRRDRFGVRGEAPAPQQVAIKPSRRGVDTGKRTEVLQRVTPNLEFEAPKGAGLDGVTDVAVVMANAMSRLAEERPELRTELETMQRPPQPPPPPASPPAVEHRSLRRPGPIGAPPPRQQQPQPPPQAASDDEDRPGRRRRRRRRRGRRSEGGLNELRTVRDEASESLLQQVAQVMTDAGPRSLHIRQIAETLAGMGVLGGEISEIERAVTAAILLDIRHGGRASRFIARGDARYQLHASRVPPAVTTAEQALHAAIAALNNEIANAFVQWLQTLGPRGLEAVARIWLTREGYPVLATLPPSRGIAKLVIGDIEGESDSESEEEETNPKLLALILPRRAGIDASAWAGDLERTQASGCLVFCMGDAPPEAPWGDSRVVTAHELAAWLRAQGVGISPLSVAIGALDPTVLESISGLDT